jgi:hypothetical protein
MMGGEAESVEEGASSASSRPERMALLSAMLLGDSTMGISPPQVKVEVLDEMNSPSSRERSSIMLSEASEPLLVEPSMLSANAVKEKECPMGSLVPSTAIVAVAKW